VTISNVVQYYSEQFHRNQLNSSGDMPFLIVKEPVKQDCDEVPAKNNISESI